MNSIVFLIKRYFHFTIISATAAADYINDVREYDYYHCLGFLSVQQHCSNVLSSLSRIHIFVFSVLTFAFGAFVKDNFATSYLYIQILFCTIRKHNRMFVYYSFAVGSRIYVRPGRKRNNTIFCSEAS